VLVPGFLHFFNGAEFKDASRILFGAIAHQRAQCRRKLSKSLRRIGAMFISSMTETSVRAFQDSLPLGNTDR
jgi:hypothetical protein